jgi:hypothetical protein
MNLLKRILGHKEVTKDNPSDLPVFKHTFKKMKKEDLKSDSHPFANYVPPTPTTTNSKVTPPPAPMKPIATGPSIILTLEEKNVLGKLKEVKNRYTKLKMINELINSQKYDSKGRLEGTSITKSRLKELVEIAYS